MNQNEKDIIHRHYRRAHHWVINSGQRSDELTRRAWAARKNTIEVILKDLGYTERQLKNLVKDIK